MKSGGWCFHLLKLLSLATFLLLRCSVRLYRLCFHLHLLFTSSSELFTPVLLSSLSSGNLRWSWRGGRKRRRGRRGRRRRSGCRWVSVAGGELQTEASEGLCCFSPRAVCRWCSGWICTQIGSERRCDTPQQTELYGWPELAFFLLKKNKVLLKISRFWESNNKLQVTAQRYLCLLNPT